MCEVRKSCSELLDDDSTAAKTASSGAAAARPSCGEDRDLRRFGCPKIGAIVERQYLATESVRFWETIFFKAGEGKLQTPMSMLRKNDTGTPARVDNT